MNLFDIHVYLAIWPSQTYDIGFNQTRLLRFVSRYNSRVAATEGSAPVSAPQGGYPPIVDKGKENDIHSRFCCHFSLNRPF